MVGKERKDSIIATLMLLCFIALILFGWYEMLSTPKTSVSIFIAGFLFMIWAYLYTTGDFLPANVMKTPVFVTRAGGVGAFQSIEHLEGGISKAYVSVRKAHAYDNNLKPKPRGFLDAFASSLTPNAVVEVLGNTEDFIDVPRGVCDSREGAIFFWGSLNPDKEVTSEYAELRTKLNKYEALLRELITIFESSKAVSGKLSEEEANNMVETSLKANVVLQNIAKVLPQQPRQQQSEPRF